MPERSTVRRARRDKRAGKSASTQAGEFVREEMRHIREGKHGARSTKQAIAIGLSKARRSGVQLAPPKRGTTSSKTRRAAKRDLARGKRRHAAAAPTRSRAVVGALKRERSSSASRSALSRQARASARKRSAAQRSASARKAVRTKGAARRSASARKAARTRARQAR
ncbi:MAG TPA: DUF6496 domain-containing protein [Gemmatimonadaceae bacterium]